MNQSTKKLAFIGGGINSAVGYTHFCASRLDGYFELVAGAFSRDSIVNKESAARYGVSAQHCYDNWQKMIMAEKDKIDALVILTPTPTHQEIIEIAIEKEIPIICEKALAHNWNACKKVQSLVNKTRAFLAVTFNYTGYPMVREMRAMIKNGQLGKLFSINVEMPQEGFARLVGNEKKPQPQRWRLEDGDVPTIYLDLAVHMHHLIKFTTGLKPLEAIATESSYGWFPNVVDHVSSLVKYEDDVSCQFTFSKSSLGHRNGLKIQICGSEGALLWEQSDPEKLQFSRVDGSRLILERGAEGTEIEAPRYNRFKAGHPSGFIEAFANLYQDFSIALNSEVPVDAITDYNTDTALEGMALIKAMTESSRSLRWEKV